MIIMSFISIYYIICFEAHVFDRRQAPSLGIENCSSLKPIIDYFCNIMLNIHSLPEDITERIMRSPSKSEHVGLKKLSMVIKASKLLAMKLWSTTSLWIKIDFRGLEVSPFISFSLCEDA